MAALFSLLQINGVTFRNRLTVSPMCEYSSEITTAAQTESIITEQKADLVLMAREFLRDPYFPMHAARELEDGSFGWPVQYERAKLK